MKKLVCIFCLLTIFVFSVSVAQAQDYTHTIDNGEVTITGYTGPGGSVTIPDTIEGLPVTAIGNWAFVQYPSLTRVTISNNVTTIGVGAFYQCSRLTHVTIGNGVTTIRPEAFTGCTDLTSIIIPNSVTDIGDLAFGYCTNLVSVTIGNRVINIEAEAFYRCYSLTSVRIPNSVTKIAGEAFSNCGNLSGIYFLGNAPIHGQDVFLADSATTIYYLSGTVGWTNPWCGRPTALWAETVTLETYVDNGHGTLTPVTGPQNVNTVVDLMATPDIGYQVKAWTGTDDDSLRTNSNTVTMTQEAIVSVEFEQMPGMPVVDGISLFVLALLLTIVSIRKVIVSPRSKIER